MVWATASPFRIRADQYDLIKELARARDISVADWLREAVREKIERDT
jgi:hypothetical protein